MFLKNLMVVILGLVGGVVFAQTSAASDLYAKVVVNRCWKLPAGISPVENVPHKICVNNLRLFENPAAEYFTNIQGKLYSANGESDLADSLIPTSTYSSFDDQEYLKATGWKRTSNAVMFSWFEGKEGQVCSIVQEECYDHDGDLNGLCPKKVCTHYLKQMLYVEYDIQTKGKIDLRPVVMPKFTMKISDEQNKTVKWVEYQPE